jgi:hypothetical protein
MFGSIPSVFGQRNSAQTGFSAIAGPAGQTGFSAIAGPAGPSAFGLASQSQPTGFAATGEVLSSGFGYADANSLFDSADANSSGFGVF